MRVTAIIAAGGHGHRFGGARPKQLVTVGGRSLLERSVTAFLAHPAVDIVVSGAQRLDQWQDAVRMIAHPIPDGFWRHLRDGGLVVRGAPLPV